MVDTSLNYLQDYDYGIAPSSLHRATSQTSHPTCVCVALLEAPDLGGGGIAAIISTAVRGCLFGCFLDLTVVDDCENASELIASASFVNSYGRRVASCVL